MTVQQFTDAVEIDGSQDITQLKVQGHSTQTEPLQVWEDSAGDDQAQITGDGRLQVGSFDNGMMATDDSLIEAHRDENDTTKPKRGLHLLGEFTGTLDSLVSWAVQELVLKGTGGISALHSVLRVRLTNENTGTMASGADLRGADVEVINNGGSNGNNVPEITGLRVGVTNQAAGYADTAYGLKVELVDDGSLDEAYAIHTDQGVVHLGDELEVKIFDTLPSNDPSDTDFMRLVATVEEGSPRLYGKLTGQAPELIAGGSGGSDLPAGTVMMFAGIAAPMGWLLCDGKALSRTTYGDLFAVVGAAFTTRAALATRTSDSEGVFAFANADHGLAVDSATLNLSWFNGVATISSVTTSTEVITTAADHYFTTGNRIWVSSTGNLPGGLSPSTDYYVRVLSATTLSLHPTYNDAVADTNKINLTSAGSGTRLITPQDIASRSGMSITDVSGDLVTLSGGTGDNLPVVGTIHEIECESDQFFLPDLRGRVAVGTGQGSGLSNRALGDVLGEEDHALTIAELPSHDHDPSVQVLRKTGSGYGVFGSGNEQWHTNITSFTGNDQPHNNMQPSLVLSYIIKI